MIVDKPTTQILSRLKNSQRPYLIAGSLASYRYHRWLSPAPKIIELKIFPDDYEWWKNLLQGEAIYVSDTPPTSNMMESLDVAVLLRKNLNAQIYHDKRTFDDLYFESPEELCIDFLTGLTTETSIMETLAILLKQRQTFHWDYFCKRVITLGLVREVGILLDIINEDTQQNLIPPAIIVLLFHKIKQEDELKNGYFPFTWRARLAIKRQDENEIKITYPQISQKWKVKVILPRYIMEKLILDLDYAWRSLPSVAHFNFADNQPIPQFAD